MLRDVTRRATSYHWPSSNLIVVVVWFSDALNPSTLN